MNYIIEPSYTYKNGQTYRSFEETITRAVKSSKVGSVNIEEMFTGVNLLINSNFKDPINTTGKETFSSEAIAAGGDITTELNCIDCWGFNTKRVIGMSEGDITVSVNGDGLAVAYNNNLNYSGYAWALYQKLKSPARYIGEYVTVSAGYANNQNGKLVLALAADGEIIASADIKDAIGVAFCTAEIPECTELAVVICNKEDNEVATGATFSYIQAEIGKAPTAYKSKSREAEALLVDYICGRISGGGGASSSAIDDIISGATTVGNAAKLTGLTAKQIGAAGANNLLTYPYANTTKDQDGISWVDNGYGVITASGTNELTTQNIFNCRVRTEAVGLILTPGTYTVSGCPAGGSNTSYYIQVGRTLNDAYARFGNDYGNGVTFTITEDTQIQIQPIIAGGYAINGEVVFKPMLEFGSIAHDFVPYYYGGALSSKEINGFSIYTLISQLGIDSYHIPDIVRAMPENSMFVGANTTLFNSEEANNNLPTSDGYIEITRTRTDIGRTKVLYFSGVTNNKQSVYVCNLDEENWVINGWIHLGDGGDAATVNGYRVEEILTTPHININEGDNLNSYITPGVFRCASSSIAKSLLNCPYTDSGFKFTVRYTISVNHILQTIESSNKVSSCSRLMYYNTSTSTWTIGNWYSSLTSAGGTSNGSILLDGGENGITLEVGNDLKKLRVFTGSAGDTGLYDKTLEEWLLLKRASDNKVILYGTATGNLSSDGGTVNGNITIGNKTEDKSRYLYIANKLRTVFEYINANGAYALYDDTNGKVIIQSSLNGTNTFNGTASGNLALTGGILNSSSRVMLKLQNTSSADSSGGIGFLNKDGISLGELNVGIHGAYFIDKDGNGGKLLNTCDKPTGSYTGDGSNTARTITTGGIGFALAVYSANGSAIILPSGAICINGGIVSGVDWGEVNYGSNGVLTLKTTSAFLNQNGIRYDYQVL